VRRRAGWDCRIQIKNSFIKVTLCILATDSRKVKAQPGCQVRLNCQWKSRTNGA
jgi:hypothetical protein